MASADLTQELDCSVCLSTYTDPVMLSCGHNFCRVCIGLVLDTQAPGFYTCPECRTQFSKRPALTKNRKLCSIVECFLSNREKQNNWTGVACTYCQSKVPAAKTCVHCEASLCEMHLARHSRSVEHVLTEPTFSLEDRRCPIHKEPLKYYCCKDTVCVCVSCCLVGDHQGHQVESLEQASEKRLKDRLYQLTSKREEVEKRVENLKRHVEGAHKKAADVTQAVIALFRKLRKKMKVFEKRVLSEISRQEEQVYLRVSDLIERLEVQKEELVLKMRHMEKFHRPTDPLIILIEEQEHLESPSVGSGGDHSISSLDEAPIALVLEKGFVALADMLINPDAVLPVPRTEDLALDVKTACNYIDLSDDLKTAIYSPVHLLRPDGPERFETCQVLSTRSFSSGQHYWEVLVSEAKAWSVGLAYGSMERRYVGNESYLGYNDKSWSLEFQAELSARHNDIMEVLTPASKVNALGVYLNYESGQVSFYKLCEPIRHLYTFRATFSEPLYAAFYVHPESRIKFRN
ncbi:E3 ubiquitin/ISG15 ligase TRIM25-like [Pelodytes ibericus]